MFSKYFHRYFVLLAIAILWEITTFSIFSASANVQIFEPPTSNPAPKTTIGGGRRSNDGQCLKNRDVQTREDKTKKSLEQQLTPILPPNKFGLTVSSNPTFFAYIPKTSAIAVEFTLENQQGKGIARKTVTLTSTPSIVNVQFEKTPLEVGKDYKWLISVICETGDPEDTFSEGIIRRIKPESTLLSKLEKANAIERVSLYAKFGIWHEAISSLASLLLAQPNSPELKTSWLTLLKSTSLEFIANMPLTK
ncbi:membrane proteins related to metalloendopeptidases [Pseudanabaena sp. lw0831]|uniref:DUF928 domain-containing protein n=1 Tax=Pseudanabaena sp. lw0831 TaxID=1357935 RepID=UPI001915B50B|nr:DUF928 domain-containing protein [Pseudanabaena sp. lw0831]GBO53087.1 membrane proteins related to metalloendopeptidases [Pseudanabaena sp. lw0831]